MSLIDKRINALVSLGKSISIELEKIYSDSDNHLKEIIKKAGAENPWFTEKNILTALEQWVLALKPENVNKWTSKYINELNKTPGELTIAVVNAGNIPFVGLHDLLTVILCGHYYSGKNATGDSFLLPYISELLCEAEPSLRERIRFVPRLDAFDAVIATGNNNSARYFKYYFGKYPHIIRRNRNGAGILTANESKLQLQAFGKDMFSYFGLGCRNISKLYVPAGYNFNNFFEAMEDYKEIMSHNKYMNNFEYNNSVFLLKQIPFLQNGFLIVRKENQIASPVSVLHYEEYSEESSLIKTLTNNIQELQCIVSDENILKENKQLENIRVDFGMSQSPALWEYADGVDTVAFLTSL